MGSCTAGGAYVPAMSDETVIVREQGTIFLGGPPLVKAATGEEVTRRGARRRRPALAHARASPTTWPTTTRTRWRSCARSSRRSAPPAPSPWERIAGRAAGGRPRRRSTASSRSTCARPTTRARSSRRIVDGSRFHEFKALYGTTLVCGFAHIHGHPVGILANNGILFCESALKGAHFIELCDQRSDPAASSCRTSPASWSGASTRRAGSPSTARRWSPPSPCARVPKLTVIVGGSFGAGNYGMCGRAYSPRFLWMWPNARISVMGGEQAATVMETVGQPEVGAHAARAVRAPGPPVLRDARGCGTTA